MSSNAHGASGHKRRPVWEDRFRTPEAGDLVDGLNKSFQPAVTLLREALLEVEGVKERVCWRGVWKWTLGYVLEGMPGGALAFIVADPAKPRLSIPISELVAPDAVVKKLPKFVRDAIAHAPIVDGVRWAAWDVQTKAQAEELAAVALTLAKLVGEPVMAGGGVGGGGGKNGR